MMFHLTVETPGHGHVQAFLAARDAQQPSHAGRWISELGRLNQVLTLREVVTIPISPALPVAYPVQHRETRLLGTIKAYRPSADQLFELREYAIVPGQLQAFIGLMQDALPVRERHSLNSGVWVPLSGDPDRVLHLWSYRDFAHRDEARSGAMREPLWREYLEAIAPLLGDMHSTILRPA